MTVSPNKALQEPAYNSSRWDTPLNANFVNTDAAFGGVQAFNLASASGTVGVTASIYAGAYPANTASYIPLVWSLTGALTANVNLQIPSGVGGRWLCNNVTTAAHTITISSAGGGASITATQGAITDFYSDGTNIFSIGSNSVPVGTLVTYSGSSAPAGFLLSYGQSLSTSTYSALYAVIGYTFGGSGSSFNTPDMRGRIIAAPDNMGGSAAGRLTGYVLGTTGGGETVTLTTAQIPAHNHTDSGHSHGVSDPGHSHVYSYPAGSGGNIQGGSGFLGSPTNTNSSGTGISISTGHAAITNTGGGTSHPNVQPTIAVNWAIKY